MKKFSLSLSVLILTFALCACTTQPEPAPTIAPLPPTETSIPMLPTATPEPTPEPVDQETVHDIPAGGFSFRSLEGYQVELFANGTLMRNSENNILIELYGYPSITGMTNEDGMAWYIVFLEDEGVAELKQGESYPISVDGFEGLLVDVTGTLLDKPVIGQAVVVTNSEERLITGLYAANIEDNEENWDQVRHGFETVWQSIAYIDLSVHEGSECEVSTDPTYGYTNDNPIKIGGGREEGPAREKAYLDSLCGPNGEVITYYSAGSLEYNDTILDGYEVFYDGSEGSVILIFEKFEFEPLMAPVGFNCWVAFPISEPE